ncbi:phosphocholine-specific phospholipase C [Amycolatopsis sp. cmx-11-12]|uniref:phosphocholine-specific phospholipase C n=1 Tax=Amycolatopsis sp. cmx-11-12 TaxID=2785795 RepID=UPI0039174C02
MRRRTLLKAAGAASAFTLLPESVRQALAADAPAGGLDVIEHVVVFMQENRSFDHYLGTLRGVRGFNDPAAIKLPSGASVFQQPNGSGTLLPYAIDDQFMADVDHSWSGGHRAWNKGRHDAWCGVKGVRSLTYHTRSALRFYHELADAFTVCDAYHCSELGPTNPNRMYLFTGKLGFEPDGTTRAIGNDAWQNPGHTGYTWKTYAERLQTAGRSWRVYQEWDNYGDNSLDYFSSFLAVGTKALSKVKDSAGKAFPKLEYFYYALDSASAAERTRLLNGLAAGVATLTATERALYDRGLARVAPKQLLSAFKSDVDTGKLPSVSWIVAPESQTEHPAWGPNTGADLVKSILDTIASKPAVWNKTLFLLTYDEDGGFFDHVPPPAPPASDDEGKSSVATTDEFVSGEPIGLGVRVPMFVISPWSRGGKVCSEVFDHTSVLRFLERWSGVGEPNISPWRRTVCGDLTSALDTTAPSATYPALTKPVPTSGPWNTQPQPPSVQKPPVPETGVRTARPLPYQVTASGRVTAERFWIDFANTGSAGAHFYVYATAHRTDGPWRYTVGAGATLSDYWQVGSPDGAYDLTTHGPNGFVRRFAGNRITATTAGKPNPEVVLRPGSGVVYLKMTNAGAGCELTVRTGNRGGGPWTYSVAPGATVEDWFSTEGGMSGWYDLTVQGPDGFLRRFAGHVETGAETISDPVMGSGPLAATVRSADSQETAGESGAATNAVDGNPATHWHTKWSGGEDPLPHELHLDLGAARTVTGLAYLPRQDGSAHGRAGGYEVYLSADGSAWGNPVATGTFADDAVLKTLRFWPARARYVRFRALTEAGGRGPWTSAAEVTPLGWT